MIPRLPSDAAEALEKYGEMRNGRQLTGDAVPEEFLLAKDFWVDTSRGMG
ncbi:MAG: hypothetical protein ACM3U2_22825 [Deltaproteobacteria bacterium]